MRLRPSSPGASFHSSDSLADHQNQVSNVQTSRAVSGSKQLSSPSSSLQSEGDGVLGNGGGGSNRGFDGAAVATAADPHPS